MKLAEAFEITQAERARLETAPFLGTDDNGWMAFAQGVQQQVLRAYAADEITLERTLKAVMSCSLGCRPATRVVLLAGTALSALQNPPRTGRKGKRQPNPEWVRNSAATLVQMLHQNRPDEPLAPNEMNGYTTPILEDAILWLVTLGLCERSRGRRVQGKPRAGAGRPTAGAHVPGAPPSINPRTLYKWYGEFQRAERAALDDGRTAE